MQVFPNWFVELGKKKTEQDKKYRVDRKEEEEEEEDSHHWFNDS